MNTWWHRLFLVLEIALVVLGLAAFAVIFLNDGSTPLWGALIALVPAVLMRAIHAVVAYIVHG